MPAPLRLSRTTLVALITVLAGVGAIQVTDDPAPCPPGAEATR